MLTLIGGRSEVEMTREDVEALIRIDPVLKKLNLSLFCLRCNGLGNPDGVRSVNGLGDSKWLVECGCSIRMHRRHADPSK